VFSGQNPFIHILFKFSQDKSNSKQNDIELLIATDGNRLAILVTSNNYH